MKFLILCLSLLVSTAARAGENHTVILDEYLFRGTLTGMTDSLQEQLAKALVTTCGESARVKMNSLSISFKRGELAGKGPLDTKAVNDNGKFLVDFPGHPKAVITASFDCP